MIQVDVNEDSANTKPAWRRHKHPLIQNVFGGRSGRFWWM